MKKRILAGAAVFGLSVLVAGAGPVFAGGGGGITPQEHWLSPPPESVVPAEAIETGTLLLKDAGNPPTDIDVRNPQPGGDASAIDEAWRWRESGGQ